MPNSVFQRAPRTYMGFTIRKQWVVVFAVAAILRGLVFFQVLIHPSTVYQPDSRIYTGLAEGIQQHGAFCHPGRADAPDLERMPGYPLLLAGIFTLTGGSVLAVVAFQALLDALSCVLVGFLGERVWSGAGLLSGLLAAVNLNMITYAHFILNDSVFLFLFLLWLLSFERFIDKPELNRGLGTGALLGLATLVRPVAFYLPLMVIPFAWITLIVFKKHSFVKSAAKVLIAGLVFVAVVFPWLARNYMIGGRLQLTIQGGEYLALYVVPFVWQYSKDMPFIEGMKKMNTDLSSEAQKEGVNWGDLSPLDKSQRMMSMGLRVLRNEPLVAIAKAWLFGMAKNLFAPAVVDFSNLLGVERPHFFYTDGNNVWDRSLNFVKGLKGWVGWATLGSLISIPLLRLLQLWGMVLLIKKDMWLGMFFALIIVYFLLISGPIGYAKYRIPFEPILIIFLAVRIKEFFSTGSSSI